MLPLQQTTILPRSESRSARARGTDETLSQLVRRLLALLDEPVKQFEPIELISYEDHLESHLDSFRASCPFCIDQQITWEGAR